MSGKPNSAWLNTMINKFGSREAVTAHMKGIGSDGGRKGTTGGFASKEIGADGLTGQQRASLVGQRGGAKSKRTK